MVSRFLTQNIRWTVVTVFYYTVRSISGTEPLQRLAVGYLSAPTVGAFQ